MRVDGSVPTWQTRAEVRRRGGGGEELQCIVGMTKLAPSLRPEGHRVVTVFVFV